MKEYYYQQTNANPIFITFEKVDLEEAFNVTFTYEQLEAKYDRTNVTGYRGNDKIRVHNYAQFLQKVRQELETKGSFPFTTGNDEDDRYVMDMNDEFKPNYGVSYSASNKRFVKYKAQPKKAKSVTFKHGRWLMYDVVMHLNRDENDERQGFYLKIEIEHKEGLENFVRFLKRTKLIDVEMVKKAYVNCSTHRWNKEVWRGITEEMVVAWWDSISLTKPESKVE